MNSETLIYSTGGLCNRIQGILSHRAVHGPLRVYWPLNNPVAYGRWEDAFNPLDGVSFVYLEKGQDAPSNAPETFFVHHQAPPDWVLAHGDLKPVPDLRDRILKQCTELDEWDIERDPPSVRIRYNAIHVRRTDFIPHDDGHHGHLEQEDEFVTWGKQWGGRVYIATDNGETQRWMLEAFNGQGRIGTELPGCREQEKGDDKRQGSIQDAVQDLFVCAGAERFKGTRGSSFSETIERMRAASAARGGLG